jgi:hypothetical protein
MAQYKFNIMTVDVTFTNRLFRFFHQAQGHSYKIFIQNSGVFWCGSTPRVLLQPSIFFLFYLFTFFPVSFWGSPKDFSLGILVILMKYIKVFLSIYSQWKKTFFYKKNNIFKLYLCLQIMDESVMCFCIFYHYNALPEMERRKIS